MFNKSYSLSLSLSLCEVFAKALILHLTVKKPVCIQFGQNLLVVTIRFINLN